MHTRRAYKSAIRPFTLCAVLSSKEYKQVAKLSQRHWQALNTWRQRSSRIAADFFIIYAIPLNFYDLRTCWWFYKAKCGSCFSEQAQYLGRQKLYQCCMNSYCESLLEMLLDLLTFLRKQPRVMWIWPGSPKVPDTDLGIACIHGKFLRYSSRLSSPQYTCTYHDTTGGELVDTGSSASRMQNYTSDIAYF